MIEEPRVAVRLLPALPKKKAARIARPFAEIEVTCDYFFAARCGLYVPPLQVRL